MPGADDLVVALVEVDSTVLEKLISSAISDACANEVTAPVTSKDEWSLERVVWLRRFHEERRSGLDGPLGEATWAVTIGSRVVGSARLKRTDVPDVLETGLWLTSSARGHGIGRTAMGQVVSEAKSVGARAVHATTTDTNAAALTVLRRVGFTISTMDESPTVHASFTLGGS